MASITPCLIGKERNLEGICVDCPENYFSSDGLKCKECTTCSSNHQIIRECSSSRNRRCSCPEGQFWNEFKCKECTSCYPGYYQQRDCKQNRDRTCTPCSPGETSNIINAKGCYALPKQPPAPTFSPNTNAHDKGRIQFSILSSSIGLLVFVLIGLAAYFIRKKRKERFVNTGNNRDEEEPLQDFTVPDPSARLIPENGNENLQLVRNLRSQVIEDLALKLNPVRMNDWRALADRLGYNSDRIDNFKLEPTRATQNVLDDWSTKQGSTVLALFNHLTMIHRDDAASIVKQHVYNA